MSEVSPTTWWSSNLTQRLLSGVVMMLVAILSLAYGTTQWVGLLVLVVVILGMQEYRAMLSQQNVHLNQRGWLYSAFLLSISPLLGGIGALNAMMILVVGGWILNEMVFSSKQRLEELHSLGWALFGLFWVGWSFPHMTLIKDLPHGELNLCLLLVVIVLTDSLAYFGGRRFGKTSLAPGISPKKTREGSFCGTVGGMLVGSVIAVNWLEFSWPMALLLTFLISVLGQVGDLVESKMKRLCGVKDSGKVLPGHGGILDRLDSFLLTTPFFYYWILLLA